MPSPKSFLLEPPRNEIKYPNNGGLGGAYIEKKAAKRLSGFETQLPPDYEQTYKYGVQVLGGFAPDAGMYTICVTDDLEVAAKVWTKWQNVCATMVAVFDRDTNDQVEPYGFG